MKIFISHAHEDVEVARRIAEGLRSTGLDVWLAESEIMPGENYAERISQALGDAQGMVVVLTPHALRSPWVRQDIEYALGNQRYSGRVVPVVAAPEGDVPPNEIPWILRQLQMVILTGPEPEAERISQIAAVFRKAS